MQALISLPKIKNLKQELGILLPKVESSHRVEAMARGLGWNTYSSLLTALRAGPVQKWVSEAKFRTYLSEHGHPNTERRMLSEAILRVFPADEQEAIDILVGRSPARRSTTLQYMGLQAEAAWTNIMVAAINAGLDLGHFGLEPGDNRFTGESHIYRFEIDGLPAIAYVAAIRNGGLMVHAAVNPTRHAEKNISAWGGGFIVGEGVSMGWLERAEEKYLDTTQPFASFRQPIEKRLADLEIEPNGFATEGRIPRWRGDNMTRELARLSAEETSR